MRFWDYIARVFDARAKWIMGVCREIALLKLSAAAARDGVQMAGRHREITFFSCIVR